LLDADYGSIQLYNPHKKGLEIVVQRGFPQAFLDTFKLVSPEDNSACGRALRKGARIVIEDVLTDEEYTSFRDIAAAAGYRAVQSTPLLVSGGPVLGILSTHFRSPHRPSEHQLRLLDLYARQASELVDRLRSEHALRESEDRFRRALQPRNVGIVFLTTDGIIHEANDAFLDMSGYTRADLADGGLGWERLTPPEWHDAALGSLAEFRDTGVLDPREHDLLRKDGSRWYALCSATRIADSEGVGYLIDITDRKRAEQALRDADRRKDEFLATLAHELRNPLAPISNAMCICSRQGARTAAVPTRWWTWCSARCARSCASSTTCSKSRGSRAARSNCGANPWSSPTSSPPQSKRRARSWNAAASTCTWTWPRTRCRSTRTRPASPRSFPIC
jgi:PAS domain S-box-containing protein